MTIRSPRYSMEFCQLPHNSKTIFSSAVKLSRRRVTPPPSDPPQGPYPPPPSFVLTHDYPCSLALHLFQIPDALPGHVLLFSGRPQLDHTITKALDVVRAIILDLESGSGLPQSFATQIANNKADDHDHVGPSATSCSTPTPAPSPNYQFVELHATSGTCAPCQASAQGTPGPATQYLSKDAFLAAIGGQSVLAHWQVFYCGGAPAVERALVHLCHEYRMEFKAERFEW